ncbi:hypothetical protein BBK36DRAFT_1112101 [Trichoderma citrinoviride]|uniref:Uncharacterized protein n=1 Tax=Trichoderma citrinoviride TaxID=58853 RepID=A0A2T4BGS3_9HYPO|nr:hypothetical protein BBK36DRAFT_1112101 [Trichoderma citrinoviride]PTB68524.1 hypothetical protein BBK36DRAFT_1112101 [Trichoderma citrinoviride]
MSVAGNQYVTWYDPTTKEELKARRATTFQRGKGKGKGKASDADDGMQGMTDPDTVNFKTTVFNKVAKSFSALFSDHADRYERRKEAPVGWTTAGELGWLREEQDSQYMLMEELELKIEELKKELTQQQELVKAYEVKVAQHEEYLQYCMHWITMAQVFGDVPVAKERMKWKSGLAAFEEDKGEDKDEDEAMGEDAKGTVASGSRQADFQ